MLNYASIDSDATFSSKKHFLNWIFKLCQVKSKSIFSVSYNNNILLLSLPKVFWVSYFDMFPSLFRISFVCPESQFTQNNEAAQNKDTIYCLPCGFWKMWYVVGFKDSDLLFEYFTDLVMKRWDQEGNGKLVFRIIFP